MQRSVLETIVLALVLDTYVYTWFPNSRTRLGSFRLCVYKEVKPVVDPDKRYRWYLYPYLHTYCDPYVIYPVPIEP